MSEVVKPPSESAGEGVAEMVPGGRAVVLITPPTPAYASESAGEGVAERGACVSQSHSDHTTTDTDV